jgi:hypothetical protein
MNNKIEWELNEKESESHRNFVQFIWLKGGRAWPANDSYALGAYYDHCKLLWRRERKRERQGRMNEKNAMYLRWFFNAWLLIWRENGRLVTGSKPFSSPEDLYQCCYSEVLNRCRSLMVERLLVMWFKNLGHLRMGPQTPRWEFSTWDYWSKTLSSNLDRCIKKHSYYRFLRYHELST